MRPFSLALTVALLAVLSSAGADSIPKDKLDEQKVFGGDPKKFSKPAEIEFVALVKSTPEYKTIKQESLKTSAARYWILMTQAQERVAKSIKRVAREEHFDLVCEKGTLEPFGIEAPDITKLIKQNIAGESQGDAHSEDGKPKTGAFTELELETLKSKVRVKVEGG